MVKIFLTAVLLEEEVCHCIVKKHVLVNLGKLSEWTDRRDVNVSMLFRVWKSKEIIKSNSR